MMIDAMTLALIDKIEREYGRVYVPVFRDNETLNEYIIDVWTQAVELFDSPVNIKNRTATRFAEILNERDI